ncbi:uncharacterized protein [Onthophagus taurus]|uniref:uncharacterized protein n=1 Tax=Onthophagus taurus TaxID=166361 RepID=UPI000C20F2FB|nr:uncharacterized protein LOC111420908 [Onthophagus taurus]
MINSSDKCHASEFVDNLLNKGGTIRCDETNEEFNRFEILPEYFDEEKFKCGQNFFYKHLYAMFFAKILGLTTILSVPDLAQILKFTKMSSEPLSAYKRYLSTVFHMVAWYDHDFQPNSKVWKSIEKVRFKHNSASKRCCSAGFSSISQKNMALTQFGFMGFVISETETVGIYNASKQELEGFIHIWRIVGYLMGMEDRFNICRDSLEETKGICHELIRRVFREEVRRQHQDYLSLTSALINGMWCMMPVMNHHVFLYFINEIVCKDRYLPENGNNNEINNDFKPYVLNAFQKFYLFCLTTFFSLMRFTLFRIIHVYNMYVVFWLMHNFPFLAYYKYGKKNSHVEIFD